MQRTPIAASAACAWVTFPFDRGVAGGSSSSNAPRTHHPCTPYMPSYASSRAWTLMTQHVAAGASALVGSVAVLCGSKATKYRRSRRHLPNLCACGDTKMATKAATKSGWRKGMNVDPSLLVLLRGFRHKIQRCTLPAILQFMEESKVSYRFLAQGCTVLKGMKAEIDRDIYASEPDSEKDGSILVAFRSQQDLATVSKQIATGVWKRLGGDPTSIPFVESFKPQAVHNPKGWRQFAHRYFCHRKASKRRDRDGLPTSVILSSTKKDRPILKEVLKVLDERNIEARLVADREGVHVGQLTAEMWSYHSGKTLVLGDALVIDFQTIADACKFFRALDTRSWMEETWLDACAGRGLRYAIGTNERAASDVEKIRLRTEELERQVRSEQKSAKHKEPQNFIQQEADAEAGHTNLEQKNVQHKDKQLQTPSETRRSGEPAGANQQEDANMEEEKKKTKKDQAVDKDLAHLKLGQKVAGKVVDVKGSFVSVDIGAGCRAQLHSQALLSNAVSFSVDQKLPDLRISRIEKLKAGKLIPHVTTDGIAADYSVGEEVCGKVAHVLDDRLMIEIPGFCSHGTAVAPKKFLEEAAEKYCKGEEFVAEVAEVRKQKNVLILKEAASNSILKALNSTPPEAISEQEAEVVQQSTSGAAAGSDPATAGATQAAGTNAALKNLEAAAAEVVAEVEAEVAQQALNGHSALATAGAKQAAHGSHAKGGDEKNGKTSGAGQSERKPAEIEPPPIQKSSTTPVQWNDPWCVQQAARMVQNYVACLGGDELPWGQVVDFFSCRTVLADADFDETELRIAELIPRYGQQMICDECPGELLAAGSDDSPSVSMPKATVDQRLASTIVRFLDGRGGQASVPDICEDFYPTRLGKVMKCVGIKKFCREHSSRFEFRHHAHIPDKDMVCLRPQTGQRMVSGPSTAASTVVSKEAEEKQVLEQAKPAHSHQVPLRPMIDKAKLRRRLSKMDIYDIVDGDVKRMPKDEAEKLIESQDDSWKDAAQGERDPDEEAFLQVLPKPLQQELRKRDLSLMVELALDFGKEPVVWFRLPLSPTRQKEKVEGVGEVGDEEFSFIMKKLPKFTRQNRSVIEGTLHRVSRSTDSKGRVNGLTMRFARHVRGCFDPLADLLAQAACAQGRGSILLIGGPGRGKTTLLREVAAKLSEMVNVIIVDKSNEIAGESRAPHRSVGDARRLQVSAGKHDGQNVAMLEALENHTPDIIVADEVSTREQAMTAKTIVMRGVRVVCTCHGSSLADVVANEQLNFLVGGIQSAAIGDSSAQFKKDGQKFISQRQGSPVCNIAVELRSQGHFLVHRNVADSVDHILEGVCPRVEVRVVDQQGNFWIATHPPEPPYR